MALDFTKFSFPSIEDAHAATLTGGITAPPITAGYVVITLKGGDFRDTEEAIRAFALSVRADAQRTGCTDITAYRQLRLDELGGAVPFDQAICDRILKDVRQRRADHTPAIEGILQILEANPVADWVLLAEFSSADQARAAAVEWTNGGSAFAALGRTGKAHSVSSFVNKMRYASVSRDPNLIQFFNLFPGPGDAEGLWAAWQEALPWFFEIGEIRSSFPLAALDPEQPMLLVNYAHCDSVKHFLHGIAYDPVFGEIIAECYLKRGFEMPHPFFCKIVPV